MKTRTPQTASCFKETHLAGDGKYKVEKRLTIFYCSGRKTEKALKIECLASDLKVDFFLIGNKQTRWSVKPIYGAFEAPHSATAVPLASLLCAYSQKTSSFETSTLWMYRVNRLRMMRMQLATGGTHLPQHDKHRPSSFVIHCYRTFDGQRVDKRTAVCDVQPSRGPHLYISSNLNRNSPRGQVIPRVPKSKVKFQS